MSPALRQPFINHLEIDVGQIAGLLWRQELAAHPAHRAVRRYRLTNNPLLLKKSNLDSSFLCRGHRW